MDINEDELKKAYMQNSIIGGAMIFSVFVYAAVVELLKKFSAPHSSAPAADMFGYLFFLVSLCNMYLIPFLRDRILASTHRDSSTNAMPAAFARAVKKVLSASLVSYMLCNAIGLYGLLLFLLTRNHKHFYGFMLLSLLFFSFYFPRYYQWREWMEKVLENDKKPAEN
jgi:hypothetical protein